MKYYPSPRGDKCFYPLGRYYFNDKSLFMFSFSASGFKVGFKGTSLKAIFSATEINNLQGRASIAIVIDNEPFVNAKVVALDEETKEVVLADHLPKAFHEVAVYKCTESACSLTGLVSLETDGNFEPLTIKPRLKIEIYGDSITAGNGVLGVVGDDNFETRTENALISYGALASEALDAEFSLIAIGGYALYKSPWNTDAPIKNIPQMFSFADCTWSTTEANSIKWDHSKFIPDIVVINLGTNDDQYLLPLKGEIQVEEASNFKKAYKTFLDLIFKTYPKCQVIASVGMIKVSMVTKLIEEVIKDYPHPISFLPFDSLKVGGYMANGGHPNKAMHEEAAKELVKVIKGLRNPTI
jgi:hypothetical protein